jgi:molybdenum-dependent DNA-binding transcriptional regulator ModE
MSKTQNRNMGTRRRQGNVTPQKANNNIIEDLMGSEEGESQVADLKRMMIRKFNELEEELKKKNMQKQFNKYQESMGKKLQKTQKQLNELKGFQKTPK